MQHSATGMSNSRSLEISRSIRKSTSMIARSGGGNRNEGCHRIIGFGEGILQRLPRRQAPMNSRKSGCAAFGLD